MWSPMISFVHVVWVPDCWFGFSRLGYWGGGLFLVVPFPDLCLLVLFFILSMSVLDSIGSFLTVSVQSGNS